MKSRIRQTTFKRFNWGGKRRGAGRKPKGERAGVSHAKRPEIDPRCPLHVTLKLEQGITTMRSWNELDLLHRLVKDLNAGELVQVIEFSLQHNHVHLILEAKGKEELSSAMKLLRVALRPRPQQAQEAQRRRVRRPLPRRRGRHAGGGAQPARVRAEQRPQAPDVAGGVSRP